MFQTAGAKKGFLTCGLFYADKLDTAGIQNPDPQAAANKNTGLATRASFFAGSKEVELIGPVNALPHYVNRMYPTFVSFDWKFSLNPQSFILMTNEAPATTSYRMEIRTAEMLVKRVSVNPSIRCVYSIIKKGVAGKK